MLSTSQYVEKAFSRSGRRPVVSTVATGEATDASGWRKIEGGVVRNPRQDQRQQRKGVGSARGSVDSRESSDPIGKSYCSVPMGGECGFCFKKATQCVTDFAPPLWP